MYFEHDPYHKQLHPFIDKIWYSWDSTKNTIQQDIHPDATADIIVIKNNNQLKTYACGVMTRTHRILVDSNDHFWGLRFKPGMASLILGTPLNQFSDQVIELDYLMQETIPSLDPLILNNTSLEDIFMPVFAKKLYSSDHLAKKIKLIEYLNSIQFGDISKVANELLVSRRTLNRYFQEYFGFPARSLHNIKRFMSLKVHMDKEPNLSLAEYAQLAGYYDQADMTRQVKKSLWYDTTRFNVPNIQYKFLNYVTF